MPISSSSGTHRAWDIPALPEISRPSAFQRAFDVLVAAAALVALSPLFLLVALAIRIDSPGPIVYTQRRVGLDRRRGRRPYAGPERRDGTGYGQPFAIYKFRSMVVDAEAGTGAVWARTGDPRVTRVGAILRRLHLDEFPQFYNVLLGEMTLVGPRPERPELVRELVGEIPDYALRSRVLPGITGLAQLENGYDDSIDSARRKVAYDIEYIRNRSFARDLAILLGTARIVLLARQSARRDHDAAGRPIQVPRERPGYPERRAARSITMSSVHAHAHPDQPAIPVLTLHQGGLSRGAAARHVSSGPRPTVRLRAHHPAGSGTGGAA